MSRRPWLLLALICVPVFIGSLDLTIVSAFLPEIIVKLQLPVQSVVNEAAWIVTGYLLAYTISLTFMGRVSDLVGRRRAYIICLVIFMIGSFVVAEVDPDAKRGLASILFSIMFRLQGARPDPSNIALTTVIIGRVIQALGAGSLVPVTLALVGDLFPAAKRAQPLGVIGAVDTLGWVLGHLYGGIMVRLFAQYSQQFSDLFASLHLNWAPPDWRALFWINLPISLLALVLTWWALRDVPQDRGKGRFDFLGTAADRRFADRAGGRPGRERRNFVLDHPVQRHWWAAAVCCAGAGLGLDHVPAVHSGGGAQPRSAVRSAGVPAAQSIRRVSH